MPNSDKRWVERALGGSEEAYRHLLEQYQRPVFSVIVRMVRDYGLAEDLTQETFIKAFRALDSFDRKRKFSSWLFSIAHNTTIDHLRRKQVPTVSLEPAGDDSESSSLAFLAVATDPSPEQRVEHSELAAALEVALSGLRPEYSEVLVLRFQQGLAYEEISEVTGLALGTVKTHLYRARKALAEALAQAGWDPGRFAGDRR
jgi:RNA polymerase sigma-70 factor (ECF subfamily)